MKKYKDFLLEFKNNDITNNPNFWEWFGDSKIVDENGKPKIFYHATTNDFNIFKRGEFGIHLGTLGQVNAIANNKNSSIMPVYVKAERSLIMKDLLTWRPYRIKEYLSEIGININVNISDNDRKYMFNKRYLSDDKKNNQLCKYYWNLIIKELKKLGYDSIIYRNDCEYSNEKKKENSIIVFNSNQIKSIYNIGTFNSKTKSILEFKNNDILSNPNFIKWFGKSKVVDENGNPEILYHSTKNDFDSFKRGEFGIHLGTLEQVSDVYGTSIIPVYVKIENPLIMADLYTWYVEDIYNYLTKIKNLQINIDIDKFNDEHQKIIDENNSTYLEKYHKLSNMYWDDIISELERHGYDGIKYLNKYEGAHEDFSYIAFNPNQIKSIYNKGTFDFNSSNILEFKNTDVLNNPNFIKWFGNSKGVDENGNPQIYYHGTKGDFDIFNRGDFGIHFGTYDQANDRIGMYNPNINNILNYKIHFNKNIIPVYLKFENPIYLPDLELWYPEDIIEVLKDKGIDIDVIDYGDNLEEFETNEKAYNDIISQLIKLGYDSVIYKNEYEGLKRTNSVIVFNPNQIKSIYNKGTFNINSDSILEKVNNKIIAYHGTYTNIHTFVPTSNVYKNIPKAVYFTSSKKLASQYGKIIKKVELKLNNPLIIDMEFMSYHDDNGYYKFIESINQAYDDNHDGLILENFYDSKEQKNKQILSTVYVVFDNKNIKIIK